MKLKIQIFDIHNNDNTQLAIEREYVEASILRKILYIPKSNGSPSSHSFDYSFDIAFDCLIDTTTNHRLNTKIMYLDTSKLHDNRSLSEFNSICYTRLAFYQKIIICYYFRRLWLQKPSNIMWLINICVALLAIIATIKMAK